MIKNTKFYQHLEIKRESKNTILSENHREMLVNPDFAQDYYSRTAEGIYKIGSDSIRLLKWLAYYDRYYYENINYYDMMGTIVKDFI